MKKALPFIIGALLLIIIVAVILKKRQAAEEVKAQVDQDVITTEPDFVPFPTENQNPAVETIIAPTDTGTTPPVVSGSAPIGTTCLNNTMVVSMIDQWKELKRAKKGLVKRIWIKNELRDMCPQALNYLVV